MRMPCVLGDCPRRQLGVIVFEIDDVIFLTVMTGGYVTMKIIGVDEVTTNSYIGFCLLFWLLCCDSGDRT